MKRAQIERGRAQSPITPAMAEFRRLIESDEEFVRNAMQDAVREVVTGAVKDNILGAAEIITGLLPKVLAGLARDLESKDWMIRSRAQAAVLKYAMEFRDKENSDANLAQINVLYSTKLPDTPLGHAVQTEIVQLESGETVEEFELDYWKCWKCGDRHPQEAMRGTEDRPICSSCQLAQNFKSPEGNPGGIFEYDPEFGT